MLGRRGSHRGSRQNGASWSPDYYYPEILTKGLMRLLLTCPCQVHVPIYRSLHIYTHLTYLAIYPFIHLIISIYQYSYLNICLHQYLCKFWCIYIDISVDVYIYIYIDIYIYICLCMHTCLYVCIYIRALYYLPTYKIYLIFLVNTWNRGRKRGHALKNRF